MKTQKLKPVHPGEILFEDFLKPMHISQYQLAKDICVPLTRISAIIKGKRAITADTALRLSYYFGLSRDFWIGLQNRYDMDVVEDEFDKNQVLRKIRCHTQLASGHV